MGRLGPNEALVLSGWLLRVTSNGQCGKQSGERSGVGGRLEAAALAALLAAKGAGSVEPLKLIAQHREARLRPILGLDAQRGGDGDGCREVCSALRVLRNAGKVSVIVDAELLPREGYYVRHVLFPGFVRAVLAALSLVYTLYTAAKWFLEEMNDVLGRPRGGGEGERKGREDTLWRGFVKRALERVPDEVIADLGGEEPAENIARRLAYVYSKQDMLAGRLGSRLWLGETRATGKGGSPYEVVGLVGLRRREECSFVLGTDPVQRLRRLVNLATLLLASTGTLHTLGLGYDVVKRWIDRLCTAPRICDSNVYRLTEPESIGRSAARILGLESSVCPSAALVTFTLSPDLYVSVLVDSLVIEVEGDRRPLFREVYSRALSRLTEDGLEALIGLYDGYVPSSSPALEFLYKRFGVFLQKLRSRGLAQRAAGGAPLWVIRQVEELDQLIKSSTLSIEGGTRVFPTPYSCGNTAYMVYLTHWWPRLLEDPLSGAPSHKVIDARSILNFVKGDEAVVLVGDDPVYMLSLYKRMKELNKGLKALVVVRKGMLTWMLGLLRSAVAALWAAGWLRGKEAQGQRTHYLSRLYYRLAELVVSDEEEWKPRLLGTLLVSIARLGDVFDYVGECGEALRRRVYHASPAWLCYMERQTGSAAMVHTEPPVIRLDRLCSCACSEPGLEEIRRSLCKVISSVADVEAVKASGSVDYEAHADTKCSVCLGTCLSDADHSYRALFSCALWLLRGVFGSPPLGCRYAT